MLRSVRDDLLHPQSRTGSARGQAVRTYHVHGTRSALKRDGADCQDRSPAVYWMCPHILDSGAVLVSRLSVQSLLHVLELFLRLRLVVWAVPQQRL